MADRNTFVSVPDVSDPIALQRFLQILIEKVDQAFSVRSSTEDVATVVSVAKSLTSSNITKVGLLIEENSEGILKRLESLETRVTALE